ncbi:MAG: hypothetical protein SWI22_07910 [Pseudomonadota bacterium]|nr:hypothetical protein [Pseudomonadota bacterium]
MGLRDADGRYGAGDGEVYLMTQRAIITALFGFTAMFIGAALAWSLATVVGIGWTGLNGEIPERQYAYSAFWAGVGLLVFLVALAWLVGFLGWVRRQRQLRVLLFLLVISPFLFGFVWFGQGLLSVITQ